MIAKLPEMLLILLALLTLFGLVIGYCIASIRIKRTAHRIMESERARLRQVQRATVMDLQTAKKSISLHRKAGGALEALESQTKSQAKRIKSLEAQLHELQGNHDGATESLDESVCSDSSLGDESQKSATDTKNRASDDMIQQLSPEMDIPNLDESEMPELVDDLEFDTFEQGAEGSTSRG